MVLMQADGALRRAARTMARRRLASTRRRGQSTVEYMLYVSVVLISLLVVAYAFMGPLDSGWRALEQDVATVYTNATRSGNGDRR